MLILALIAALLTIPGFSPSISGPSGGVVLEGVFPDAAAPAPLPRGFVYLPPGFWTSRRYPVIYCTACRATRTSTSTPFASRTSPTR